MGCWGSDARGCSKRLPIETFLLESFPCETLWGNFAAERFAAKLLSATFSRRCFRNVFLKPLTNIVTPFLYRLYLFL